MEKREEKKEKYKSQKKIKEKKCIVATFFEQLGFGLDHLGINLCLFACNQNTLDLPTGLDL